MHLLIHRPLVDDAAARAQRSGSRPPALPPPASRPRGRARPAAARVLALLAGRLDGEAARRAVA